MKLTGSLLEISWKALHILKIHGFGQEKTLNHGKPALPLSHVILCVITIRENTKRHRMTKPKSIELPPVGKQILTPGRTLPFNGYAVSEKSLSFSFSCFDRSEPLFNLGSGDSEGVLSGRWFVDLLDCLKNVSNTTIPDLQTSMHDLHRINWKHTNVHQPANSVQYEYWQFRVSKSKGRVIGILIDRVFYLVWLDPHHNLTNCDGYEGPKKYNPPQSEYEQLEAQNNELKAENKKLKDDLEAAEKLLFKDNKS